MRLGVAVIGVAALLGMVEAKRSSRKVMSPTISGVVEVYAKWSQRPELIEGVLAPPPEECADEDRKPPCSALTRVFVLTFFGYWMIFLTCHALSSRLLKPYRKDWELALRTGWCAGLASGCGAVYVAFNAYMVVVRNPIFAPEPPNRILAARTHELDVLLAYAIGLYAFQFKLAAVCWAVGAKVDMRHFFSNGVVMIVSGFALVHGKWGVLGGALLLLEFAVPFEKLGWLLTLSGARDASVAFELWDMLTTVVVLGRTAVAIAMAARAATSLEGEMSLVHPRERTSILGCLLLIGVLIATWVMVTRQRLRKLGGSATTADRSKPKQD